MCSVVIITDHRAHESSTDAIYGTLPCPVVTQNDHRAQKQNTGLMDS